MKNITLPPYVTNGQIFFEKLCDGVNPATKWASVRYDDPVIGTYFAPDWDNLLSIGKKTWLSDNNIIRKYDEEWKNNFYAVVLKFTHDGIEFIEDVPNDIQHRIINVITEYLNMYGKTIDDCCFPNVYDDIQYTKCYISFDHGVVSIFDSIRLYTGEKFKKISYEPKYSYARLAPITFLTGLVNYKFDRTCWNI